jgi:hypothetical protein
MRAPFRSVQYPRLSGLHGRAAAGFALYQFSKLIRNGKGEKSVRELRIRHRCGVTMKLQRSPPTRPRTRERPTAQVLPFEKPKR